MIKISNVVMIYMAALTVTNMAYAESFKLRTQTGNEIGLSLSTYKYQEPGLMSSKGAKLGLDVHGTEVLPTQYFISSDLLFSYGSVDYSSPISGTASGEPDWYIEARVLVGKDWPLKNSVFSPYTGLGYRYLFNDARGISSTGSTGYRRESNYIYLPVGVVHRTTLNKLSKLVSTLEYDHLLEGKQASRLSDTGFLNDVSNTQSSGFGLKLSVIYENDNWAIGPFAHYWNISKSNTMPVYFSDGTLAGTGVEPKNNTVEFGLRVSQHF